MKRRSWHQLERDPEIDRETSAPDVGWINQMRFLLSEYAMPKSRVLDPFAGFGTTLVACELEGHDGYGIELDAARVAQANSRLQIAPTGLRGVRLGTATELPFEGDYFDLILTSIPYFGGARSEFKSEYDLYAKQDYLSYLGVLERTVVEMKRVLKRGGTVIAAAENIRIDDDRFVPLAWDFASLIAKQLTLRDERILVYQPRSFKSQSAVDRFQTDRSHEYVIVGEKL
jgi:SAM-dependent methyltransferase